MHLLKNSAWCRVVSEALLYRGFFRWTGVPRLFVAFRNADGLVAEIRGGYHVRFVWPNSADRVYKFARPTDIDRILDELLGEKSS